MTHEDNAQDAKRYRWLKSVNPIFLRAIARTRMLNEEVGRDCDACIDAAMHEEAEKDKGSEG